MSKLNDYILSEGVEQLETESGRLKFLENLKKIDINCDEETLVQTVSEMNLIPSYPKNQRDLVSAVVSNLSCPELIYEEFVSDDDDDIEGNLLETLNVISDSSRFYESEYAEVVESLFHTEKPVFQEYVHMDTIWTKDHLVSDSELFVPYAFSQLTRRND